MRHNHLSAGAAQQQQQTAPAYHRPHRNSSCPRVTSTLLSSHCTLQQYQSQVKPSLAAGGCWPPQQTHCKHRAVAAYAGPPEAVNTDTKKLAVFLSGGGSNFKAIHAACLSGHVNAEVVVVVSDVPSCGGVAYAQEHGIPTLTYPASKKGLFPGLSREQLVQEMADRGVDYVLLAGYLKVATPLPP
eukprot:GHUV01019724.1.p1 GENE.GHUV01019724.1~~GHUV01019724.1.p1  ORF type:complete len:186 (+),score=41.85 GHUV01019724.1:289-846(+)